MSKKALILGASGFLGSQLSKECLKHNWQVTASYFSQSKSIPTACQTIKHQQIFKLKDEFDYIFLSSGNYQLEQKDLLAVNLELPLKISQHFRSAKLIFISSIAVYGNQKTIIGLNSTFNNPDAYGQAKLAGEFIVSCHSKYAILRLTYLYGKGLDSPSFLPTIISAAKEKQKIILRNAGERLQDYLHVNDAAKLCVLAAQKKTNAIYLGASGKSYSNLQVAKIIQKKLPQTKIIFQGRDNALSYKFNNKETKKQLKWQIKEDFKISIKAMI